MNAYNGSPVVEWDWSKVNDEELLQAYEAAHANNYIQLRNYLYDEHERREDTRERGRAILSSLLLRQRDKIENWLADDIRALAGEAD
ncbi:hypothetical protein [Allohahella sp. A8]|uniref:hypothetical protein n=1 Tax=Allohahella sp. A8 TaxID=3141461 RepID=UPI003A7FE0A5